MGVFLMEIYKKATDLSYIKNELQMLFFNGRVEMFGFSVYLDMTPSNKFKYFVKI